jgi:DNA-binding transcriptional MerR regulator/methylmalonyl-CoA mutase cobalamin-binding subunit
MARSAEAHVTRHPIGVVAKRTGLSPDVLRVWERRYEAVEPARADGRRRLYSDADIERLRLMRLATDAGRSISQVARLSTGELSRLVRDDEDPHRRQNNPKSAMAARTRGERARGDDVVNGALARARALDAAGLESLLRRSLALVGVWTFVVDIAAPLLRQVGEELHAGRLARASVHLVSTAVRRVLDGVMPVLAVPAGAPNLLIATPISERQEVDAIMAAAVAATEGWRVTYLGPDVPAGDIASAASSTAAHAVGVTVGRLLDREAIEDLRLLRERLPANVPLLIGGSGATDAAGAIRGAGIQVIESLAALRLALRSIGQPGTSA